MHEIKEKIRNNPEYLKAYQNEKWFYDSVNLLMSGDRDALDIIYQLSYVCTTLGKEVGALKGKIICLENSNKIRVS